MNSFKVRNNNDRGANMVEYGLMVAVIALVALAAVTLLGDKSDETFTTIAAGFEDDGSSTVPGHSDGVSDESGDSGAHGAGGNGGNNSGEQNQGDPQEQGTDQEQGADQEQGDAQGEDQHQFGNENDADDNEADGGSDTEEGADADAGSGGEEEASNNGGADEGDENSDATGQTGPASSGTSSELYWWDSHNTQGQWKASVSYQNETNRHQYLTLQVTTTDDKGRTTTTTVKEFYVGATSSATYTHWSNDIDKDGNEVIGVVKVEVKVVSVRTSDQNWQTYSYEARGTAAVVTPPTLP